MCMSQNDSIDVVWSISPDTFGITSSLQETSITTAIEGRVWALEESPEPCLFEAKVAGMLFTHSVSVELFLFDVRIVLVEIGSFIGIIEKFKQIVCQMICS